jgi:hypothetical protein
LCAGRKGRERGGRRRRERLKLTDLRVAAAGERLYFTPIRLEERQGVSARVAGGGRDGRGHTQGKNGR